MDYKNVFSMFTLFVFIQLVFTKHLFIRYCTSQLLIHSKAHTQTQEAPDS